MAAIVPVHDKPALGCYFVAIFGCISVRKPRC